MQSHSFQTSPEHSLVLFSVSKSGTCCDEQVPRESLDDQTWWIVSPQRITSVLCTLCRHRALILDSNRVNVAQR
jgi:hypothetical protein